VSPDWFQCRLSHNPSVARPAFPAIRGRRGSSNAVPARLPTGTRTAGHDARFSCFAALLEFACTVPDRAGYPTDGSGCVPGWRNRTGAWRVKADVGTSTAPSPKLDWIARFGYAARGLVYVLAGLFSLAASSGHGGHSVGPKGAFGELLGLPFGGVLITCWRWD
jgi:hypothetical protein